MRISNERVRQVHNLILDTQKLMFSWSRSRELFEGTIVHEFIGEWDSVVMQLVSFSDHSYHLLKEVKYAKFALSKW